jgi:hypothetical protein
MHICENYKHSLTVKSCISTLFSPGETWDRARKLKEKMAANLAMAKDRLEFLGQCDSVHNCC